MDVESREVGRGWSIAEMAACAGILALVAWLWFGPAAWVLGRLCLVAIRVFGVADPSSPG